MSVTHHHVHGYEGFLNLVKTIPNAEINVLFTGTKENGISWCPDCVEAEPFIEEALKNTSNTFHFITVEVGGRAFWKDMNNPFRTDKSIHISVIPTLVHWKNPERLEGPQCQNADLLEMFFNDV